MKRVLVLGAGLVVKPLLEDLLTLPESKSTWRGSISSAPANFSSTVRVRQP